MAEYEDKYNEYLEMYETALANCQDGYKGYYGANALSFYVYEKYNINAASNDIAHDALCKIMESF